MSRDDAFVHQTMLTCIGNKRKLVHHLVDQVRAIAAQLNKDKLVIVDGFAGSGVVSRALAPFAARLYTNDLEQYAYLMARCFLQTPDVDDRALVVQHVNAMNRLAAEGPWTPGLVCKLYAPRDTHRIQAGERCFYTRENALIIDTLRAYVDARVEPRLRPYCLAPLLTRASIHANTSGVFKGFHKQDGVGKFGGRGANALGRITKPIRLDVPVWSEHAFASHCTCQDVAALVSSLPSDVDVLYLDPPYNQHPYGSNYFMLNVIARNVEPASLSRVSGIPTDWNRSPYNSRTGACAAMQALLAAGLAKAKYVLVSYNNEGIIAPDDWARLLAPYTVTTRTIDYAAFKGSRNRKQRPNRVTELLYVVSTQA